MYFRQEQGVFESGTVVHMDDQRKSEVQKKKNETSIGRRAAGIL